MKLFSLFFRLIRWQNLLVIALAQSFLHFLIFNKIASQASIQLPFTYFQFILLVISTLLIAAAGNILNDIADYKLDQLNKPDKVVVGKHIKLKSAHQLAWIFNGIGFSLALYLAYLLDFYQLAIIQAVVILLLKQYSSSLKNKVLVGNLLIAFFTALSVFLVYLYNTVAVIGNPIILTDLQKQMPFIFNLTQAYVFFAFISNLMREIIKDIEDVEGDKVFHIQTFSVVYGINKAKNLARVLNGLLGLSILAFAAYAFKMDWYYMAIYLVVATFIPVIYFEMLARKAKLKEDFRDLSFLTKIIMVAGILSMQVLSLQF